MKGKEMERVKSYKLSREEIKQLFGDNMNIERSAYTQPEEGHEDERYMHIEEFTPMPAPVSAPQADVGLYTFTQKQRQALRDMLAYLVENGCKEANGAPITKTTYALLIRSSFNTNKERSDLYKYWSDLYYSKVKPSEVMLSQLAKKCCCNAVLDMNVFSGMSYEEAAKKIMSISDMETYRRVDKVISRVYSKWFATEAITGEYKNKLFAAYKNATGENMPLHLWGSMNRKYYAEYMKEYSKERDILKKVKEWQVIEDETYTENIRSTSSQKEIPEYAGLDNENSITFFITELYDMSGTYNFIENELFDMEIAIKVAKHAISKIKKDFDIKVSLNQHILNSAELWHNDEEITAELVKACWE